MSIRIVIAEDQRLLRGALASLLDLEDDLEIAGQAKDGDEALKLAKTLQPDVCLLDIEMPQKSGLEVAELMHQAALSCRVIMLTTFARPGYFERAVKAGVHGYLLKDEPIDRLADAIRRVMQGYREVSPELIFGRGRWDENPLSPREREMLRLAATGMNAPEIAAELYLSPGTVRNVISAILDKLGAKNRMEAVRMAEEKGWL
ncbi:response regulator transcription factor [Gorillibacterium massiliense]|uniref:response regulator transcription factor n=1 Tax=Gorillibacterium massiliense TaxID=1280390 RepID=UPI0004AF2E14|nr:response regulator transcription factor [Gorillibacterium massiliense]